MNATPLSRLVLAAGLAIVKVSVVDVPSAIEAAVKVLVIRGGASTVTVAVATAPLPPSTEVTAYVVLRFWPAEVPVTLTENEQLALAAGSASARFTLLDLVHRADRAAVTLSRSARWGWPRQVQRAGCR